MRKSRTFVEKAECSRWVYCYTPFRLDRLLSDANRTWCCSVTVLLFCAGGKTTQSVRREGRSNWRTTAARRSTGQHCSARRSAKWSCAVAGARTANLRVCKCGRRCQRGVYPERRRPRRISAQRRFQESCAAHAQQQRRRSRQVLHRWRQRRRRRRVVSDSRRSKVRHVPTVINVQLAVPRQFISLNGFATASQPLEVYHVYIAANALLDSFWLCNEWLIAELFIGVNFCVRAAVYGSVLFRK